MLLQSIILLYTSSYFSPVSRKQNCLLLHFTVVNVNIFIFRLIQDSFSMQFFSSFFFRLVSRIQFSLVLTTKCYFVCKNVYFIFGETIKKITTLFLEESCKIFWRTIAKVDLFYICYTQILFTLSHDVFFNDQNTYFDNE